MQLAIANEHAQRLSPAVGNDKEGKAMAVPALSVPDRLRADAGIGEPGLMDDETVQHRKCAERLRRPIVCVHRCGNMVTAFCAQGVCIGHCKTVSIAAQLYDAGFITIKRW